MKDILVVSNLFLNYRFQKALKGFIDREYKIDIKNIYDVSNINKNKIKYSYCVIWYDFFLDYPDLGDNLIFQAVSIDEIQHLYIENYEKIKESIKGLADAYIWISQDEYFQKTNKYFKNVLTKYNIAVHINQWLKEIIPNEQKIINLNYLIAQNGLTNSYSQLYYYRWGNPYSEILMKQVAQAIYDVIKIYLSISPKCVILDCDNVLWEGILEEIGPQGINFSESGRKRKFLEFQKNIVFLYKMGIIICLCSKNDFRDVKDVFDNNSEMILKWYHISAYQINWNEKSKGISEIANELGIQLKDILFVDDNRMEIGCINQLLPEVGLLRFEIENVNEILNYFFLDDVFDSHNVVLRQKTYSSNIMRRELAEKCKSYDDYIEQLDMIVNISKATTLEIARVAELSKRTNRCTNGYRFNAQEIKAMMKNPQYSLFSVKVQDKYGDLGLVGCFVICQKEIILFALSCRALGRNIEKIMLKKIVDEYNCLFIRCNDTGKNNWLKKIFQEYGIECRD